MAGPAFYILSTLLHTVYSPSQSLTAPFFITHYLHHGPAYHCGWSLYVPLGSLLSSSRTSLGLTCQPSTSRPLPLPFGLLSFPFPSLSPSHPLSYLSPPPYMYLATSLSTGGTKGGWPHFAWWWHIWSPALLLRAYHPSANLVLTYIMLLVPHPAVSCLILQAPRSPFPFLPSTIYI